MIERLQKISAELFKNALKTYTAKDVLTHKRAHANNIPEMLAMYPNKGLGFNIHKKGWTAGLLYEIKRAEYKSHRNAVFYGVKQEKDYSREPKTVEDYPHRIQGLNKRGIWSYDLGKFQSFKNDNGVVYSRRDYEAFRKVRGIGIPKKAGEAEGQATQQEIAAPESIQTE